MHIILNLGSTYAGCIVGGDQFHIITSVSQTGCHEKDSRGREIQ